MKPFHKKLIVLSLSALVLAGSGCERRGRAPTQKKADPTGVVNTKNNGDDLNAVEKKKEETPTTTEQKTDPKPVVYEVSNEETQLLEDAAMSCKVSINGSEAPTSETFAKDFAQMRDLFICMNSSAGVKFSSKGDTWEIQVKREAGDSSPGNSLEEEFRALVKKGNDDEKSEWILKSRLKVVRLNAVKMAEKYAPGKIDQDLEIQTGTEQKKKVSLAVEDLQQMAEATKVAETAASEFASVRDGQDLLSGSDAASDSEDEASEE